MRRTLLIALAPAVVAGAIAAGATIVLTESSGDLALVTPTPWVPTPTPAIDAADGVDCDEEPRFCSGESSAAVESGKSTGLVEGQGGPYAGAPTITAASKLQPSLDDVEKITVDVVVENKTDRTFRFDRREIVLDVYRNDELWKTLSTNGEGFDLTPGGKMTGAFEQPIFDDGHYRWEAKVWYYGK